MANYADDSCWRERVASESVPRSGTVGNNDDDYNNTPSSLPPSVVVVEACVGDGHSACSDTLEENANTSTNGGNELCVAPADKAASIAVGRSHIGGSGSAAPDASVQRSSAHATAVPLAAAQLAQKRNGEQPAIVAVAATATAVVATAVTPPTPHPPPPSPSTLTQTGANAARRTLAVAGTSRKVMQDEVQQAKEAVAVVAASRRNAASAADVHAVDTSPGSSGCQGKGSGGGSRGGGDENVHADDADEAMRKGAETRQREHVAVCDTSDGDDKDRSTTTSCSTSGNDEVDDHDKGNDENNNDDDENVCCICLEPYTKDNPVFRSSCRHEFHVPCLLGWKNRCNTCPMCNMDTLRGIGDGEVAHPVTTRPDTSDDAALARRLQEHYRRQARRARRSSREAALEAQKQSRVAAYTAASTNAPGTSAIAPMHPSISEPGVAAQHEQATQLRYMQHVAPRPARTPTARATNTISARGRSSGEAAPATSAAAAATVATTARYNNRRVRAELTQAMAVAAAERAHRQLEEQDKHKGACTVM